MDINQIHDDEEIIVVGDKVDLVAQMDKVYRTMIEDKVDSGLFLAGIPVRKGVYMHVEQDDDLYLVFYRETGRYIAQMKVIALENRGGIRYMWLAQKTRVQKNQRREAYRLPVSCNVQIFTHMENDKVTGLTYIADETETLTHEAVNSRDISITGVALLTRKKYELGAMYILGMYLERTNAGARRRIDADKTPAMHLTATVKRCIPWRTGNTYDTGMQFVGMSKNMSESIARYVLTEQQRQIKRRRLL